MNGRAFIYGSLAAFAAAEASAMAIDNLTVRALVQIGLGLAMFLAGIRVSPADITVTSRRKVEPPKGPTDDGK